MSFENRLKWAWIPEQRNFEAGNPPSNKRTFYRSTLQLNHCWMKPGPQSSFLVQHISMAPWLPASSVCSFLITVHGKCPLPSPPRPVCDLHSPFPGEAPNHLLHSPLPLALYQLLQDAAESSLSWRCTATLLQEDSLPTLLVLEQGRRTRICPLIPPDSVTLNTVNRQTRQSVQVYHIYIILYM